MNSGVGARNMVGLLLVALGVIFLLDTLEVFGEDTNIIGDYWPVFIIGMGFIGWAQRGFRYALGPFLMMAVGGILLAGELTDEDVWRFWPVLLILIGLSFIWQRQSRSHKSQSKHGRVINSSGTVKINHFMSSQDSQVDGEFKGGTVTVIMSGGKLDLTNATLPDEGAVLDVNGIMSGYEVIAPPEWQVALEADAFLGSVEDKRRRRVDMPSGSPTLAIRGSVFMGSLEVKS